ncbi:MAG: hypothetical protein ABIJ18_04630 [archaeon]
MRIAILHQDLEWAEEELQRQFQSRDVQTNLYDVRKTLVSDLVDYDLVLNRVYASVANRNWRDNLTTLELLQSLENQGIPCLNSLQTTRVDYSKSYSAEVMRDAGILTPRTMLLNGEDKESALEFGLRLGYPLIVKRDMGGRGKDLVRVNNETELKQTLDHMLSPEYRAQYDAGIAIQEFLHSVGNHDCRIAIINGKLAFAYTRTLIPAGSTNDSWLASVSRGSEMFDYDPKPEEVAVALKATKSIGALFNEVDMAFTEDGIAIIENNPTPNYDETELHRTTAVAKLITEKYRKGELKI